MAKRQEVTLVSALCAEVTFSASEKRGVPETEGFQIRIEFASENEKMLCAVKTVVIRVQDDLRAYHAKHGVFPFAPGQLTKVDAHGNFVRPKALPTREELDAAGMGAKIELAKRLGLPVPQEWLDTVHTSVLSSESEPAHTDDGTKADDGTGYKYEEAWLNKQSTTKLKVLAQNEELEGYDELTRGELIEELALMES